MSFFSRSFSSLAAQYSFFNLPPSTSAPPPSMRLRQSTAFPGFSGSSQSWTRILVSWSTAPVFSRYFLNYSFFDQTPPCVAKELPETSQYQVLQMKAGSVLLFCVVLVIAAGQEIQEMKEETVLDQEVMKFKGKKENMERLLACWMTFRENYPRPHAPSLPIIKQCLQRLSNEDARNRLIAFVGHKPATVKKLEQILTEYEISTLMATEVAPETSELDKMIIKYVQKYDAQMEQRVPQPKEVREKIDEEVAKRQSYFLGFIPVNKFTTMIMLIMGGVFLLFLCSCCRFRSRKDKRKEEENKQSIQQQQQKPRLDLRKFNRFANNPIPKKYDKPKKT